MSQPFSEKQIREFARDEVRRIIDAGLMYTFEADQQVSGEKPAGFKQASEAPVQSAPKVAPQISSAFIEETRRAFPEDIEAMINFNEKPDYILISPKQFLGSENFAKIASVVRGLGGEYISAGRASHFRVYKHKGGA